MPFPGGIEDTANALLVFSVVAALVHVFAVEAGGSTLLRVAVRTLAPALLAVLVFVRHGPLLWAAVPALFAAASAVFWDESWEAFLARSTGGKAPRPLLWAACYAVLLAITLALLLA